MQQQSGAAGRWPRFGLHTPDGGRGVWREGTGEGRWVDGELRLARSRQAAFREEKPGSKGASVT